MAKPSHGVEPLTVTRRQTAVKRILTAFAVLPLLVACSSAPKHEATPELGDTSLTRDEVAKAEAVARQVIADQGASVSNASVIARPGEIKDSNTGHPCT